MIERSQAPQQVNIWRQIAAAAIVLLEVSWLTPWYRSLSWTTKAISPVVVFLALGTMMGLAYALGSAANVLQIREKYRRIGLLVFLLGSVFIATRFLVSAAGGASADEFLRGSVRRLSDLTRTAPGEIFAAVAAIWVTWRGIQMVQRVLNHSVVMSYVRTGVILFAAYGLTNSVLTGDTPAFWLYVVFLAAGLFGVGAGRVSIIGRMEGDRRSPFNRHWMGSLFASVMGTVGIAAGVGSLLTGQFMWLAGQFVRLLQWVLLGIVLLMLAPFLLVVQLFLPDLRPAVDASATPTPTPTATPLAQPPEPVDPGLPQGPELSAPMEVLPEWMGPWLFWGALLMALILMVVLIRWRPLQRWFGREEGGESMLEEVDLLELLRQAFRNRIEGARARFSRSSRLGDRGRQLAAARVRRVYAHLMDLAESLGEPRPPASTPIEFLPRLQLLFPGQRQELATITQAYVKVRYGQLPERQADLEAVETAWDKIQKEAQK